MRAILLIMLTSLLMSGCLIPTAMKAEKDIKPITKQIFSQIEAIESLSNSTSISPIQSNGKGYKVNGTCGETLYSNSYTAVMSGARVSTLTENQSAVIVEFSVWGYDRLPGHPFVLFQQSGKIMTPDDFFTEKGYGVGFSFANGTGRGTIQSTIPTDRINGSVFCFNAFPDGGCFPHECLPGEYAYLCWDIQSCLE